MPPTPEDTGVLVGQKRPRGLVFDAYDDPETATQGTYMILQLARSPENLEQLLENEALLGLLARLLQEEGPKSMDLAINILYMFPLGDIPEDGLEIRVTAHQADPSADVEGVPMDMAPSDPAEFFSFTNGTWIDGIDLSLE